MSIHRNAASGRIEATTENLSSSGLYWISPEPLPLSEEVVCRIALPELLHHHPDATLALICYASVTRVDRMASGYGIGCRVWDYVIVEHVGLPGARGPNVSIPR